jgi:hypothetical protein
MDTKANQNARKKLNELAIQHNKLTTLVACLLNEIGALKKEVIELKGGEVNSHRSSGNDSMSRGQSNPNKFPNFNELRAEDILKQLSINNSDN